MSIPLRPSLCISRPQPGAVVHEGDETFGAVVHEHYADDETVALEQLVQLKRRLRDASKDDFLPTLCDGLSRMIDSQYVFVSKKLDDGPPIGEPDSCLLALCWFWNHGPSATGSASNVSYHAFSCPCAYMKYEKILLIPERLGEFTPDNPNTGNLPIPGEAYLAIPLFVGDKCIAHMGLMWSKEALGRKRLGWGFIEMLCHALEDIVLDNILKGAEFPAKPTQDKVDQSVEDTHHALRSLHSLAPFARNLSHELRTPMQGIVGMLDVMRATMEEESQALANSYSGTFIDQLKDHLEVIQESSIRAVEAADNVVQAYSLNMGLPDTGLPTPPDESLDGRTNDRRLSVVLAEFDSRTRTTLVSRGIKRRRDEGLPSHDTPNKARQVERASTSGSERRQSLDSAIQETSSLSSKKEYSPRMLFSQGHGLQEVNIRDLINYVVNESLKAGGRRATATPTETEEGQVIVVEGIASNGETRTRSVEWAVQPSVPEHILVDEKDLAKMITCVFQNALKFCHSGFVTLKARFCEKRQCIAITVKDTGPGIPEHFRRRIFKPFAREDDSTTRQVEGLGLGLLVAKGLSRKIGGDLVLVSSDTRGENKGCVFEMWVPTSPKSLALGENPSSIQMTFDPNKARPLVEAEATRQCDNKESSTNNDVLSAPTTQTNGELATPKTQPNGKLTRPALGADAHYSQQHLLDSPPQSPNCATCTSHSLVCPPPAYDRPISPSSVDGGSKATPTKRSQFKATPLSSPGQAFDRNLATTHPLTFLVAEDNSINRKLLVNMLSKLGYDPKTQIYEAYDGADAVKQVELANKKSEDGTASPRGPIDVVLMDLWMPAMDGYEAAQRILAMYESPEQRKGVVPPTIMAVTADATDGAAERALGVGMEGFMVKPFRAKTLERLVKEAWASRVARRRRVGADGGDGDGGVEGD